MKREIQFIENELEQIEHQNIQISVCCGEKIRESIKKLTRN